MITKGTMMKALKEKGIRTNSEGKRLHTLKTSEIAVMYFDVFGGFIK